MTWTSTNIQSSELETPRSLELDGRSLLVGSFRGQPWAIEDRCSHADCAFTSDGEVDGSVAICDCHGSEFDVFTGAVLRPPASEPIAVFKVRIHDGLVEVDL